MTATPATKTLPRLEGDELFAWAQMVAREAQVVEARQQMAVRFLQNRGLVPGDHLLTPDGYILTQDQVEELERRARVRTIPSDSVEHPLPPNGHQHYPDSGN